MNINATVVEIDQSNPDVIMAAFADMEAEEENFLVLQRPIGFKDSNYYIEINDQSCASYGGIKAVVLKRNTLEVILERSLHQHLMEEGLPLESDTDTVVVHFNIDNELLGQLQTQLEQIFQGFECFSAHLD